MNMYQASDYYYLNEEVAAAAVAASAAQNLINGEAITFPSQPTQGENLNVLNHIQQYYRTRL